MKKALLISLYGLFGISLVLTVLAFTLTADDAGVSIILYWTYFLTGLAILAVIVFPVMNIVQNPKSAMKSLVGIAALIVIIGITFAFSSAQPLTLSDKTVFTDAFGLRLTDASLYTTYIAMVGAILVTVYGEIRNSLK